MPLKTIGAGITAAKAAGKDVYVAQGSYAESLDLETEVGIYGGYDHGFASRLNAGATTVFGGETAAVADGDKRVRLQLLTLRGGDMPARHRAWLRTGCGWSTTRACWSRARRSGVGAQAPEPTGPTAAQRQAQVPRAATAPTARARSAGLPAASAAR